MAANPIGHIGAENRNRFQLALAVCLLGFALTYLFNAVGRVTVQAEEQGVRLMLNQFRSALVVKGAEAMLANEDLEQLRGLNPAELLDTQPLNWGGDCQGTDTEKGSWCFHTEKHWVVYTPRSAEARVRITGESPENSAGNGSLAWQVEPEYTTRANGKTPRAVGLKLTRVKSGQINRNEGRD
ncbi:hypothetical protein SAMN05216429_111121 [Marinobacter persicus]|uniref:Uncharacterized protein n=1 Tax=Marinobacter persicus TaxID=930118 RepID=A0A1I3XBT3_9GAMM|nr:hypothetical protein [Marinobacter persicus]GHD48992.1 hypothetical protein GCM10008110_18430 [Marinobacter persicus]SFK16877.1 hypothetical protein SAMN05216429_111121 [Marinobacter persicus]